MKIAVATVFAFIVALATPARAADATVDALAWLAGYWTGPDGAVEELWLAPSGGLMVGIHRDTRNKERVFFEYLRIEARSEGVYYVARPSNQDEAEFRMSDVSANRVRFDNFAHDYPHVISYLLSGDSLVVHISGTVKGEYRSSNWIMKRSRMKEME